MEEIKIPSKAKQRLNTLLSQQRAINQQLNSYAEGLKDALCPEGDFNLDTGRMVFIPMSKEEEE